MSTGDAVKFGSEFFIEKSGTAGSGGNLNGGIRLSNGDSNSLLRILNQNGKIQLYAGPLVQIQANETQINGGFVGINTVSGNPQDQLHVNGTIRAAMALNNGSANPTGWAFIALNDLATAASGIYYANRSAKLILKNSSNVVATKISSDGFSWFDGGSVGFGTTTPASPVEMVIPDTSSTSRGGLLLSEAGDSSELDSVRVEYESRKDLAGNPGLIFTPRSQPSSGVWETFFRFKTNGGELVGNKANLTVDGKVGIGTTNDNFASRLTVAKGDIEVTEYQKGLILRSTNGTRYRLVVADDGTLTTTAV